MLPQPFPAALLLQNGLEQRKYRQRQGRFLVDGLQHLHMALDAGARPVEVFYCEELFVGTEAAVLLDRFRQTGADLVAVSEHVMRALAQCSVPQGIVAAAIPVLGLSATHL